MTSSPLIGTASAAGAVARVTYTHDAMIDMILANPAISQNELAKRFGYSVPWISRIRNSDAFLARFAERKGDIVDPMIQESIEVGLKAMANRSMDRILEKLEQPLGQSGVIETATKALEISTRALGYGASIKGPAVQQTFVVALPEKVADAQSWAARYNGTGQVVDVAAKPVPDAA